MGTGVPHRCGGCCHCGKSCAWRTLHLMKMLCVACAVPGGTYFFTVNLAERRSDTLVRHIDDLRAAMKTVKAR